MIKIEISEKKHLQSSDLSANQKKCLYAVMQKNGATEMFSYTRFFRDGFKEWELRGIDNIKKDFLKENEVQIMTATDESGDKGYAGVLAFIEQNDKAFYDILGMSRLKLKFIKHMESLGMCTSVVIKRFSELREQDFKAFERKGINAIVKDIEREINENNIV
ncbi:MAG: hypothetical protein HUK06_01590 [Bacteroidaceae bacterium]|nr:hypothetical protein [Bacteroidaceae bacterium]